MSKRKVLIGYKFPSYFFELLEKDYNLITPTNVKFTEEELIQLIPKADAVISVFGNIIPEKALINNNKTKIISNFGAGYDNINIKLAYNNDIIVTNTPDEVSLPTAELTLGLILSLLRKIPKSDRNIRQNSTKWGVMENLGNSLFGKKIGIIGLGKIGKTLARLLQAFQCNISYTQRNRLSIEQEKQHHTSFLPLNELLQSSDIICLCVPLTPQTHHMIQLEQLKTMKNTALLINTSRAQ